MPLALTQRTDARRKRALPRVLLGALVLLAGAKVFGATLDWRAQENKVSAEIASAKVLSVLEQVSEATGWQVYVEPGTEHTVSTKFKDRTVGEALTLLLGNLSYVRVPPAGQTPARLYVFRTSRREATQLVKPTPRRTDPTARPIPNELIVRVKPECDAEALAKRLNAKILGRATNAATYRLSFEDAEAAQLARQEAASIECVDAIDSNYWMRRPETPDSLNTAASSEPDLKPKSEGDCPVIGLIDTAIQMTGTSLDQFLLPSVSVAGPVQTPAAEPTHATSMFGSMMRGLAANGSESCVKVLPVDVYGPNATTTTFDVANGIIQAISKGATIINLSLGSGGDSDFLRGIVRRATDNGVLFLAAAGNEPTTSPTYPAAYPDVMAVTAAADRSGTIAPYANRGDFIDLSAPGTLLFTFNDQRWAVTGTSAATAFASGAAGGLWEPKKMTPAQVAAMLQQIMPVKK